MLKHEDSPQTQSQSAAEVRVSPEELAAAITRLEARKDASQRNVEGMVAIGEVVQQLGLDATPEEVLAEVQAGRTQTGQIEKRLSSRKNLVLSLIAGVALIGAAAWSGSQQIETNSPNADLSATPISYPIPTDASVRITVPPNLTVVDASHNIVMLSEVGDNQTMRSLLEDGGFVSYHGGPAPGYPWTLIKHDNKVYLRGWTARMSKQAMQKEGVDVSAVQDSSFTVPVTLPVNGLVLLPDDYGSRMLHTRNTQLDAHTYEKW